MLIFSWLCSFQWKWNERVLEIIAREFIPIYGSQTRLDLILE